MMASETRNDHHDNQSLVRHSTSSTSTSQARDVSTSKTTTSAAIVDISNNINEVWKRLIWAKFHNDGEYWWPSLVFQNAIELEMALGDTLYLPENTKAKCKLGIAMLTGNSNQSYVLYLGRPLSDLSEIQDHTYHDFVRGISQNLTTMSLQPNSFHNDQPLYFDWHKGLDEAMAIMKPDETLPTEVTWLHRAKDAWGNIPGSPGAGGSIAAVSMLTDDSYLGGTPTRHNRHHDNRKSRRNADGYDDNDDGRKASAAPQNHPKSQERKQQEDAFEAEDEQMEGAAAATSSAKEQQQQESNVFPLFTSPFKSNEEWKGVWNKLIFSDWEMVLDDDGNKLYYPPDKSVGMSLEEVQEYTEKHYGWKRPKTAALTADGGQLSQSGSTFGAEIEAAATATGKTTRTSTAVTTAATNRRSSRTTTARTSTTKNDAELSEEEDRKKHRQRTFGVLWTRISDKGLPEAQRWRLEKAPARNKYLADYFFVRPGCSTQFGTLGEDYFAYSDDVLEWCTNHNEGMTSSSDGSTPNYRQHRHHGSSDEDETTEHPHDTTEESEQDDDDEEDESSPEKTEEEDSFHTGRQDEEEIDDDEKTNDSKLLMTPTGCKTTPQDPGKPLLRSPFTSSSESSGSESDFYAWGPLWKYLKFHGWTWCTAKNQFEDWWYIRPGRAAKVKSGMGVQGEDYFAKEVAVIAWCKKLDLKDNERSSKKSKNKSKKDPPSSLQQEAVSKKRQGTDASRPPKRSKNDVAAAAAAAAASSSSNVTSTKPTTAIPKPTTAGSKKRSLSLTNKKPASKPIVAKQEVDDRPRPWVTRPFPSHLWNVAREAIYVEYKSGCYFLTLSDGSSHRVQSLPDVQAYCCQNENYKFLPDASQYVRDEFVRWANYAFVPGQFNEWRRVPCLSSNQAVVLIKKLGHTNKKRKGGGDTVWSPATSVAGALKEQYDSLSGLCRDLRRMEDLEWYDGLRKRNFQAKLNPKETMELRLWLAESLFDHTEDDSKGESGSASTTNIENDRDAVRKKTVLVIQNADKKRAKTSDTNKKSSYSSPIDLAGDNKPKKSAANKKGFSSPIDFMSDDEEAYSTSHLTPTEMTLEDAKRVVENLRVKVSVSKNKAPWRKPPAITDLFKRIQPLGVTFSGSSYKIPNRPDLSFTSSNEIVNYWAANGNKRNLRGLKSSTDRKVIGRLMDYANVPGNRGDWMTVRHLNVQEACCLLMVLGYICHQDKSWTVPDGLVGLNETHYETLQELCWALRQVPSLEPPVVKSSGRVSRSRLIKSSAIHDKHLLALRLFIAEGFVFDCSDEEEELSDDDDTVTTASPSANAKKSDVSPVITEKNHARDNTSAAAASVSMEVDQSSAVAPPKTSTDSKHTKATTFVEEQKRTSAKCFDMVEATACTSTLKRKSDSENSFSSTKQLPVDESTKTDEAITGAGEKSSSFTKHSPASNPEGNTNEGLVAMNDEKGNDKPSSSQQLLGVEKREESTEAQAVHEKSVAMPGENDNDKSFSSKHPQAEETPIESTKKMNEVGKNGDLVAMSAENDSDTSLKHLKASEESKMTKQGAEDLVARVTEDSSVEPSSSKKLQAPEESKRLTKTNATEEDLVATATEDGNEKSSSAGDNPEEPKMTEKGAEKNLKNEDSAAMAIEDDKSSSPSNDLKEGDNPEESTKMTQTEHSGCVDLLAADGNEARNLSPTRYDAVETPMESSAIAQPHPSNGETKSMQMPMEVDDESPAASLSASSKSNCAPIETSVPSPDKTTEPEESQTKTRSTGNHGDCDNVGSSATSRSQKVSETLIAGENAPSNNANGTDVEFRFGKTSSETASGEGAESKTQKVSTTTSDEFTQEGLAPMQVEKGEQENMIPKGQISMPNNDNLPPSYFGDTSKPSGTPRDEDVVDDAIAFNDQRGGIALFTQPEPEDDDHETPMVEARGWDCLYTQPAYESDEDFF